MAPYPQVSVIIPTYGRPELLVQCVASIFKGNYVNFEILVIDQDVNQTLRQDLSRHFPDETRLKYFFLDRAGASKARNFGIQEAKGEIVAFIDDDAIADSAWLSAIVEAFSAIQPPPPLLAGRLKPLWPSCRPDWYPAEREYLLGLYDIGDELCLLPENDQPIGANMAGLRQEIVALGGFDGTLGPNCFRKRPMLTGEEAILGQRARKAGHKIYYQPKAVVHHRISSGKLTRRYFLRRNFWEGVTVITEIHLLGDLKSTKAKHLFFHLAVIAASLGLFLFPGFKNRLQSPHSTTRMLALSKVAYSLGVLYGLFTVDTVIADA